MHVTFSKHCTCCDQALCGAWRTLMLRGLAAGGGGAEELYSKSSQ